jgi:hypothetical protein
MMKISKTESGTLIVDGIEYNAYPPPGKLIKVMKRCRAEEFISQGTMRFGNLKEYRKWENKILGDENDGNGMYAMNGHQYNTGSVNEVFAWCTSLPEISNKRIREIAKSNNYDCIVEIISPLELFRRISKSLGGKYKGDFILHCGNVSYDRGYEVDKATLNNQQFHFNVFQKGTHFKSDKEYRLSITNYSMKTKYDECVFVTIGDCHDIIELKDLPHSFGIMG